MDQGEKTKKKGQCTTFHAVFRSACSPWTPKQDILIIITRNDGWSDTFAEKGTSPTHYILAEMSLPPVTRAYIYTRIRRYIWDAPSIDT